MNSGNLIGRRDSLKRMTAAALGVAVSHRGANAGDGRPEPKSVAAVITVYQKNSHADVILGKILDGWRQDGGPGPLLKLASMYVDQFPPKDLARAVAARRNIPIFDSVEGAITLGGDQVAVDGVLSIGEHGNYPYNHKEQHLYPRRRFLGEIAHTFQKYGRVVPVFSDKHLGPVWSDALWMHHRAREMGIPFMAGSSLPVSFRKPEISVPMGCRIEAAVGVGYGGLDAYGFHALECFQCLAERRRGAETGIRWVQCLEGEAVWKAVDAGVVRRDLLDAALRAAPTRTDKDSPRDGRSVLFLFQYNDGLPGAVLMAPEFARGRSVALKLDGRPQPLATEFEGRTSPSYPHFAYLLKAIERMMHTGRPSYPVERTLLTSGLLDQLLTSRVQQQSKLAAPELAICYAPVDYPHAPHPDLNADPTNVNRSQPRSVG